MSKYIRALSLGLCALTLLFTTSFADTQATKGPSKVFVIHANDGKLLPRKDAAEAYALKLTGVSKVIALGTSSDETPDGLTTRDFFNEWRQNATALQSKKPIASLRASHEGNRFFATVNVSAPTFDARTGNLELTLEFVSYNSKQPDLKPNLDLSHPMLIIAENALPKDMVTSLNKRIESHQEKSAPSQTSTHDEEDAESISDGS